ncbi:hypothetical protein [Phormidesmis priestleyi]
MSTDMTPADNLNDQLAYTLLNKIKHEEEGQQQDIQFDVDDFEGQQVSREELAEQLNHLLQSNYWMGEIEQPSGSAPLVICRNAEITTDGRAMLKAKYFKVDQH